MFPNRYTITPHALGFTALARAGLETGVRDSVSCLLRQNGIRLMLSGALGPESDISGHVLEHGDGVRDVAFRVQDARAAFETALSCGATPVAAPAMFEDKAGLSIRASVQGCGTLRHSFIERSGDALLPGFETVANGNGHSGVGLTTIDHLAVCVAPGTLEHWVGFYERVFGLETHFRADIATGSSGMNSRAVRDRCGQLQIVFVEPGKGKRRSQIEEYLEYHRGPGVQHVAFACSDICATVRAMRQNGVQFLRIPDTYYEALEERFGSAPENIETLRELQVLVDRDEFGDLLQVFSKPIQTRPTSFLELIERKGARSFGGGNVRALFDAVEVEQARRGNL